MKLKEDKVVLVTIWRCTRGLEAQLHLFLNSALDGVKWSTSSSGPFLPRGRTTLLIDQRVWLSGSRLLWEGEKHSYSRVSKSRPTFSWLRLCTDCAIPAPYETNFVGEICFSFPSSNFCVSKEYYNIKHDSCVRKKSSQSAGYFVVKSSSPQQGKELSKIHNFMRIVGTQYVTFLFIFPYECF
jgi:hypothetical protein